MLDAQRNLEVDDFNSLPELDKSNSENASPKAGEMTDGVDQIFKALRLLPEFDGNANVLTRFIKLCDELVKQFLKDDPAYALTN